MYCKALYRTLKTRTSNWFENRFLEKKKCKQYQIFTNLKIIHTKNPRAPEEFFCYTKFDPPNEKGETNASMDRDNMNFFQSKTLTDESRLQTQDRLILKLSFYRLARASTISSTRYARNFPHLLTISVHSYHYVALSLLY